MRCREHPDRIAIAYCAMCAVMACRACLLAHQNRHGVFQKQEAGCDVP